MTPFGNEVLKSEPAEHIEAWHNFDDDFINSDADLVARLMDETQSIANEVPATSHPDQRRPLTAHAGSDNLQPHSIGNAYETDKQEEKVKPRTQSSSSTSSEKSFGTTPDEASRLHLKQLEKQRRAHNAKETRRRKKAKVDAMEHELAELRKEAELWRNNRPASDLNPISDIDINGAQDSRYQLWCERTRALLRLQSRGELDEQIWMQYLDPNVVLLHPLTPYRSYYMPKRESTHCALEGITALVSDMVSLVVALGALCRLGLHRERRQDSSDKSKAAAAALNPCDIVLTHLQGDNDFYFNETGVMVPFVMRSLNLVKQHSLRREVSEQGSLQVTFNKHDKIVRLEYVFDAVSCWRQMQDAVGGGGLRLIPNFLASALSDSSEARMILAANDLHTAPAMNLLEISHVNSSWCGLFGYSLAEVRGCTLRCMEGPQTSDTVMAAFKTDCEARRPSSMNVTLYRKDGTGLDVFVRLCPLLDENRDHDDRERRDCYSSSHLLLIISHTQGPLRAIPSSAWTTARLLKDLDTPIALQQPQTA
mmetsp:Transcript_42121/g.57473  ORF Transcript_42121/g.57473 Transcript_42121/m.57473 type:complete len:537 (-) Transcript_42121:431-2041(-)|eukprot:CAMPEP_0185758436 /NCGR_PEP_ID=MMETSP1174-20130828/17088_1 /TAXON_ID=35687 /ORGANISM="Dictyocha speculum, Strain CCMP1381" /LENGTH=536 /DNA_ID=CAMNT_0028438289 /DNA_START=68 /DNA_END=1678 /DNA_ORIENTATION=+